MVMLLHNVPLETS